jgi:hypothetical protein
MSRATPNKSGARQARKHCRNQSNVAVMLLIIPQRTHKTLSRYNVQLCRSWLSRSYPLKPPSPVYCKVNEARYSTSVPSTKNSK